MTLPNSTAERAREGAKVRREVLGAAYVDAGKQQANPFTQHFIEFTQTQCWGYAWLRDGLTHKTRSMLNVCMLAALARWHEFEVHVRGALNNGVTAEEIAGDFAAHRRLCRHPDRLRRLPPRRRGDQGRGGGEGLTSGIRGALSSTRFRPVFIAPVNVLSLRFGEAHRGVLLARQYRMLHRRLLKATVGERRSSQICAIELGGHQRERCETTTHRMSELPRSAPEKSVPFKSFQHRFDSRRSLLRNETRLICERPKNVRGNVRSDKSRASSSSVLKILKPSGSLSSY